MFICARSASIRICFKFTQRLCTQTQYVREGPKSRAHGCPCDYRTAQPQIFTIITASPLPSYMPKYVTGHGYCAVRARKQSGSPVTPDLWVLYVELASCRSSRPTLGPTQPPINGYRVFPGGKRPGRGGDHPPHLTPRLKKEYSYTSTPPPGLRGLF